MTHNSFCSTMNGNHKRSSFVVLFTILLLVILSAPTISGQVCSLYVSNVIGGFMESGQICLNPGETNQLIIHVTNTCGEPSYGYNPANAFIIWSPDGADWGYTKGITLDGWNELTWTQTYVNHFEWDGTGWTKTADSVGPPCYVTQAAIADPEDSVAVLFAGCYFGSNGGFNTGIDDNMYAIEFTSSIEDEGKHICIDTGWVPGGTWMWVNYADTIYPDWQGITCYPIAYPNPLLPYIMGPNNYSFNHCQNACIDFQVEDFGGDEPYSWEIAGTAGGSIIPTGDKTARWEWTDPPQTGTFVLQARAQDSFGAGHYTEWYTVNIYVNNDAPTVACPAGPNYVQAEHTAWQYVDLNDNDDCDELTVSTDYTGPGSVEIDGNRITYSPTAAEVGEVAMTIYANDGDLQGSDTLVWTVLSSGACCVGSSVGNMDMVPGTVDMGDLTVLIDHLFISLRPLVCVEEGDVDLSGQPSPLPEDVDMGDLTVLIDHLFISLDPLPACP